MRYKRCLDSGLLLPSRREVWKPKSIAPCDLVGPAFFGGGLPTDPSFGSVSLLLHGDGANGSTTFTDTSPLANTVVRVGTVTAISTSQFKFGGASIAIGNSASSYLKVTTNAAAFTFGTGAWTIEFWVYLNAIGVQQYLFDTGYGAAVPCLGMDVSATNNVRIRNLGTDEIASTTTLAASTWYHIAATQTGTNLRLFINGVLDTLKTNEANSWTVGSSTEPFHLGISAYAFTSPLNGYLDDFRVTKGVARYVANFTPPSTAYPDA